MSAATGLASSGLLVCTADSAAEEPLEALAAPASDSQLDTDVVWATNSHLNDITRGRAPGVYLLHPAS